MNVISLSDNHPQVTGLFVICEPRAILNNRNSPKCLVALHDVDAVMLRLGNAVAERVLCIKGRVRSLLLLAALGVAVCPRVGLTDLGRELQLVSSC
jgi:hypothetical protein